MTYHNHQFFSFETIDKYTNLGLTVDGTKGGYLIGQSHSNGGIPLLSKYKDGYRVMAEVEGDEYFLNGGASKYYEKRLWEINQPHLDKQLYYVKPKNLNEISVLDCISNNPNFKSKFLLIDARCGHFIVNKHSTAKHLNTLENLNNTIEARYYGELLTWQETEASFLQKVKNLFT